LQAKPPGSWSAAWGRRVAVIERISHAHGHRRSGNSDQAWQASWNLAVTASAVAAVACIGTWATDFRADLPEIDVPVLVIQGDADQVLPLDKTGRRLPALIKDAQLTVVEGGPHAIPWTHAARVNTALLDFIRG
jgi:non-heme chloroperoxidase